MAGIGKYSKGKKFTLKSGNTPAFKMMGSSPYKNTGDPKKETGGSKKEMTQEEKDAAIANAMGAAEKKVLSDETRASAKEHFGGVNNMSHENVHKKIDEYKSILGRTGLPEHRRKHYEAKLADARKTAKAVNPQLYSSRL